jgi:two-component system chemotaxis sensor kinase CheA
MSAAMAFEGIQDVAHQAESLLDELRRTGVAPEPALVDLLLAAADAMAAMVQRAAAGENPPADRALIERLQAAARPRPQPRAAPPPAPAEAPPAPATMGEPAEPAGAPAALRRVTVQVEVAPGCPVPAVRAFLVLKKLGSLGTVVESSPSAADLRGGRIPERRLQAVLDTTAAAAALERALSQIPDIGAVQLREVSAPAAQPAAAVAAAPRDTAEEGRTVRVRVDLLDSFLDSVGELIVATARIREAGRAVPEALRPALDDGIDKLHSTVKDLHDKVMAVRMTPLRLATDRLPRVARDLARKAGKLVDVEVRGAEIEIDRAILDELADPLVHLVRNAVDHGLEPANLRQLAGKPPTARITVAARRERDRVVLDFADDGRGMDAHKLRQRAVERGALTAAAAAAMSDQDALMLCCLPGVSTAEQVTDVSGRGVGMDAVKKVVESVGGSLEIASTPGAGTRISLRLPLTVAVQQLLLVRVGDEVLGLPISKVHGAVEVDIGRLERSRGEPMLSYGGGLVPVRDLAAALGLPRRSDAEPRQVVVVEGDGARIGLAVTALLGQEEAVLKPLGAPLDRIEGLSAVALQGNGRPVFILDLGRLGT